MEVIKSYAYIRIRLAIKLIVKRSQAMNTQRKGNQLTVIERSMYFTRMAKAQGTFMLKSLFGYTLTIGDGSTSVLTSILDVHSKINTRAII